MISILEQHEINRKLIHLSSLWIPAVIYLLGNKNSLLLFGALTALAVSIDFARRKVPKIGQIFEGIFGSALRPTEKNHGEALTGASYMMLGVLGCLFFSNEIAVTACALLMVADTAAAIVGMRFGSTRIFGKSLEGSAAFLFSGLGVLIVLGMMMPHSPHYYAAGTAAVIAATFVELYSNELKLNDNLSIPLTICFVMWGLQ